MTSSTSSSDRTARPLWARGLGLLLFAGALGGPLWALWSTQTAPERFIQEIDRDLAQNSPQLILLGNSVAREGIDKPYFSASMGLESGDVYPLLIGGSSAGHWYSALKTRVFDAGHRPQVVVIYTPFSQWRTDLGAPVGADLATLISLAERHDPVLLDKVFGGDPAAYTAAQLTQKRTKVRNRLIDSWNHGLVGLAQGDEKEGTVVARGRQVIEDAQDNIREQGNIGQKQRKGGGGTLLIVEEAVVGPQAVLGRAELGDGTTSISIDETILPELIALCRSHGARLVLVAPPLRPSDHSEAHTFLTQSLIRDSVLAGADVLDLRQLSIPEEAFATMHHVIPEYRQQMTGTLTTLLIRYGLTQPPNGTSAQRFIPE